jgi:Zn-finger nucleic acid-binding protein
MFVSAADWDTLLDAFMCEPLPDFIVPDAEETSSYGPYRSAPSSKAPPIDLAAPVHCPTCEGDMERLEFAAISGVVIDVCPDHGVWLDAGELERIIESFHPHPPSEPIPGAADEYLRRLMPTTLAEAAAEPLAPPPPPRTTPPAQATFVGPTMPVPASFAPENIRLPWTMKLRRALGRLVSMIASQKTR